MQIRWMLALLIVCSAILGAGYRLTQVEPETAAAAMPIPVVARPSLSVQATTIEEVEARSVQPVAQRNITIEDTVLGYHISYPTSWYKTELSSNVVVIQSGDGATRVKVEIASVLPADSLAGFVDRSLGQDILLTRQLLTIHGLPAERVLVYSDEAGGQVTSFYVDADQMVYVISGSGEQKLIESVARSFNAPQLIAQR
jgi:hypothetical protein